MSRRSGPRGLLWLVVLLLLAGGALGLIISLRTAPAADIQIDPQQPGIGRKAPVTVHLSSAGRGLSEITVELVQGERVVQLAHETHTPPPAWALWRTGTTSAELAVEAGSDAVPGLSEGKATVRVRAARAATWLLHPDPAVAELELPVKLRPPIVTVLSSQNYVEQGGSGVVVYRVGKGAVRDGVEAGTWFFPGVAIPERGEGVRFALFGAPYDMDDGAGLRLIAEDELGNRSEVPFVDRYLASPMHRDTIHLSDDFMGRVVPAIMAQSPSVRDQGSLLKNYLAINGELRKQNAARLVELGGTSASRFLWNGPFLQLPNSKVMSRFADRRTYVYDGKNVDQQDHLGFDLASTGHAPVPAANSGVVALAEYFGIYGNTVVIDHGYGLMSLYAHLASVEVKVGDSVKRGAIIGHTDTTGLAGGDHLHFTLLIRGLAVNPVEWWDPAWIRDRVMPKLGSAYVKPDTT